MSSKKLPPAQEVVQALEARVTHILGEAIAISRVAVGLTQAQLGERIGKSMEWVREAEAGGQVFVAARVYLIEVVLGLQPGRLFALVGMVMNGPCQPRSSTRPALHRAVCAAWDKADGG